MLILLIGTVGARINTCSLLDSTYLPSSCIVAGLPITMT